MSNLVRVSAIALLALSSIFFLYVAVAATLWGEIWNISFGLQTLVLWILAISSGAGAFVTALRI